MDAPPSVSKGISLTKILYLYTVFFMSYGNPTGAGSKIYKGRGATLNMESRFLNQRIEAVDDGWYLDEQPVPHPKTEKLAEAAKSIVTRNSSPDIGFEQSINPYRGCEHGCVYCYARPCHAYVDLSPGLDFETRIFYKQNAAALLEQALRKPGYTCSPIAFGTNTDVYQPLERDLKIMRRLLEVLEAYRHPFTLVTKSALVLREKDILARMAGDNLCSIFVSVTTLDNQLKNMMEPRTAGPAARLRVIRELSAAGVPVGVMVAPVIPAINDREMESILTACAKAGASSAGKILIRLPHEVKPLFYDWLQTHFPKRASHVKNLIRQCRGGKDYQNEYGKRMTGEGVFAELLQQRFRIACKRLGLSHDRVPPLDCSLFRLPPRTGDQISLF